MKNRKSSRLLITLVLAAAMLTALGSEAFASGGMRGKFDRTTSGSEAFKPGVSPLAGEPEVPQGAPLPPKVGNSAMSVRALSYWSLRFQWSIRVMLTQLPRRFP